MNNKIITRGFGSKRTVPGISGPITMGYGPLPPQFVTQALQRKLGQSGTKRRLAELDEVIVWAKLVELNGVEPNKQIKGWVRALVDKDRNYASVMIEHVSTRVREALETIRVTVKRIER
jgi:hypothetical protein